MYKISPLPDCSGCTDNHPEGTHQMHTKQHPCKPDSGLECAYCSDDPVRRAIEHEIDQWWIQSRIIPIPEQARLFRAALENVALVAERKARPEQKDKTTE